MLHALDLGVNRIAHVTYDGSEYEVVNLIAGKDMRDEEFYHMEYDYLMRFLNEGDTVFVEEPLVGRGGVRTAMRLSSVRGVAHLCAEQAGAAVYPVNVSTWKKEVVGKGNSSKKDVAAWVKANHPDMDRRLDDLHKRFRQDGVDAFCIALYGQAVVNRGSHIASKGV